MGLFRFSYGVALNANRNLANPNVWQDQTSGFQFTVGQAF